MRRFIASIAATMTLSGCMYHVKTMDDLRAMGPSNQQVYPMEYQKLAYCLETHAKPIVIEMQRSSSTSIYSNLKLAEVVTGYSLLELKGLDDGRTLVRSYDGDVHRAAHAEWFQIMDSCAKGDLKLPT